LSDEQFAAVFRAYRDRILVLANDGRLAYASIFKNVGAEAGASLGHTHSQIVAAPVVPELVETELASGREFLNRTRRCVFCDLIVRELASGVRVVVKSENFLVVTAFAPRFAYELWVLPTAHASRFESITNDRTLELARVMKRALTALDRAQAEPAYNWCLHTAPLRSPELDHYHWHIEVLPRTARPAGLEWGYGCFITTVAPERAAAELRAALPPQA
jgi:UDPglucose--hexose-1-phosphate uridylyltransferase